MAIQHFSSDGVEIAFLDSGEGEPILLIHGFASNHVVNWGATGWIDNLKRAGRRVVAMDVRGHGASGKLHEPEAYYLRHLARDAANLIDHLDLGRVDVMGYSMGGRIAAFLTIEHPEKVRSLIIGGMGMALVDGMEGEDEIVAALEAPSLEAAMGGAGRAYRKFAEQTGSDVKALAAVMRVARETLAPEQLALIDVPVLIAVGERDQIAGSPEELGTFIPGSKVHVIPRRDHMLATADRSFIAEAIDFLAARP
ncbi:alpha/beta fold hydrolase [Bauldia litoralis]|uniref:Pimeloyl-ACP methyl ester carboxylesterase n=1 Tax=Bauldia litoralis TaxID=665467 RepID=A0A1G6DHX8_9HYPH|nr:alpha/beta hydrolase [Bauldia litoralis]SDB44787.1 Pimeloyl-ACP methyl ester carboxylesterase [Bauldia litoralis]